MTVNVGTMQLPVTEDADLVRTYLNGTHVSGGLWTALTRASNHDHSGGLNGIQLTATSIPDGSITSAKLDPAVLLPYALVDGSKPFTGTVTMNADQLIRDTLRFGAKPAGVADTTIARTGAGALRVDTHLGVGVNPGAWGSGARAIQIGIAGAINSDTTNPSLELRSNSRYDGTNQVAIVNQPASIISQDYYFGTRIQTAPAVAAGATQTFTTRLTLDQAGNLGVGVTPASPWDSATWRAIQIGTTMALWGQNGGNQGALSQNMYLDAGGFKALAAGPAGLLQFRADGVFQMANAPSAAGAGATHTLKNRLEIAPTGTLTLTPDAGASAIIAMLQNGTGNIQLAHGLWAALNGRVYSQGWLELDAGGNVVAPSRHNALLLGNGGSAWSVVYATNGTLQPSSAAVKENITPLDPPACYQAAKDVRWYEYAYLPPVYTPPEPPSDIAYDAADDNETKAEKKAARDEAEAQAREAHLKMVAETAPARHQRGFVFPAGAESKDEAGGALPPVPDLFGLSDRESTTPQADLATLGCALQEVIRRLEALEAPN